MLGPLIALLAARLSGKHVFVVSVYCIAYSTATKLMVTLLQQTPLVQRGGGSFEPTEPPCVRACCSQFVCLSFIH